VERSQPLGKHTGVRGRGDAAVGLPGLGGAVDAQVRAGSSAFETAFPVLIGVLIWGSVWLLDHRIKQLLGRP
jgi:hypothetical protein